MTKLSAVTNRTRTVHTAHFSLLKPYRPVRVQTFCRSYHAQESLSRYDQREVIEVPDEEECEGIRIAHYGKLEPDAIVGVGTRLSGDDAIIGKTVTYRRPKNADVNKTML